MKVNRCVICGKVISKHDKYCGVKCFDKDNVQKTNLRSFIRKHG